MWLLFISYGTILWYGLQAVDNYYLNTYRAIRLSTLTLSCTIRFSTQLASYPGSLIPAMIREPGYEANTAIRSNILFVLWWPCYWLNALQKYHKWCRHASLCCHNIHFPDSMTKGQGHQHSQASLYSRLHGYYLTIYDLTHP